jgi:putative Mg2+ transporter-C (MgtC) family protein
MAPLFSDLTWSELLRACVRLLVAAMLGGMIGLERQIHRHPAGLRTHILVTLGAAAFVSVGISLAGTAPADVSRVIQGIIVGIGFLGSGTILKVEAPEHIRGLTTASGIWNAAAIGVAVGAGYLVLGFAITTITVGVLGVLHVLEKRRGSHAGAEGTSSKADRL